MARLALATLESDSGVDWAGMAADYDRIRDRIGEVIPGFEDFNTRVRAAGGFVLPNNAAARRFETTTGKAQFTVVPFPEIALESGQLLMMTIREP